MTPQQADALLARLEVVNAAEKSFDAFPDWETVTDRTSSSLHYAPALKLEGTLGGGVSIRLVTPTTGWECEVYGQISVTIPGSRSCLRLNPIEWRPRREHRNAATAPAPHAMKTLRDRWHPFDLNRPLGIRVFQQAEIGVATPLPRAISTFLDYIGLCAELWNCNDVNRIPPPPWSQTLL